MARILIIDDDERILKSLRQVLALEGHALLEAQNGAEGLDVFKREGSDIVITDLLMPEKEGIETITELRQIDPEVKIIAISGGGRVKPEDYLDIARKFGAHITLAKPFDRKQLIEAVDAVLGR